MLERKFAITFSVAQFLLFAATIVVLGAVTPLLGSSLRSLTDGVPLWFAWAIILQVWTFLATVFVRWLRDRKEPSRT